LYFHFVDFLVGTFNPVSFASLIPIAIACFLLVALQFLPDFKVPFLNDARG